MTNRLKEITAAAIFTAIICVIAQLSVMTPFGVPFSFQVLGVAVCGYSLKIKQSLGAIAAYILLGTAGLPVFTGFRGGPQVLFGVSGGFIVGFLILSPLCSAVRNKSTALKLIAGAIGVALCHLLGVIWFSFASGVNLLSGFITASLPFILKDILSVIGAVFISKYTVKILH